MPRCPSRAAIVLLLLGLLVPAGLEARETTPALLDGWMVDRWTVEDGLPLNHVRDMAVDVDGFIWFATFDGLARFDGSAFKVLRRREVPELPSNRLPWVEADPNGGVWVLSESGILVRVTDDRVQTFLDGEKTSRFIAFATFAGQPYAFGPGGLARLDPDGPVLLAPFDPKAGLVTSVSRAPDGTLWFAREDAGLYRLDPTGPTLVVDEPHAYLVDHLPDGRRVFGAGPRAWFAADDGQRVPIPGVLDLSLVCELAVDADGELLFRSELSWYRGDLSTPLRLTDRRPCGNPRLSAGPHWRAESKRLLRDDRPVLRTEAAILGLVELPDGLWLITDGDGVQRVRPSLIETVPPEGVLDDPVVYAVLPERDGVAWIGSARNGAWRSVDGGPWELFETGESWRRERVQAMARGERSGAVYVTTGDGACRVEEDGCRYLIEDVHWSRALHEDRDGTLWLTTEGNLWTGVATEPVEVLANGQRIDNGRVFADGANGELWLGTVAKGLFQKTGDTWRVWTEDDGLTSNRVRSIHVDGEDVWVGTEDGGLCRLQPATAAIACITTDQGLHDDGIHAMLPDEQGRLWMSTNRGIFWVHMEHLREAADGTRSHVGSVVLGEEHGMRNREGNGGFGSVAGRDDAGRMWFVTQDGVAVLDPVDVPVPDAPLVHLERAWVDDARVPVSEALDLRSDQRHLKVSWTSAQLEWTDDVRYRFRLTPHDTTWRGPTTDREAVWLELPPGPFQVEVQASLAGRWSPTATLAGVRRPLFSETPWYVVSLVGLALGLFGAAAGWRLRAQRRRQIELEEEVRKRTAGLESTTRELQVQNEAIASQHREIASQAARLAELNALRKRLVADLSHELRTPLALVAGPLQDLADNAPGLSPANRQRLEVVQRSVGRLQDLIGQLFDLTRLEHGRLPLRVRHADLAVLLRDVAAGFASAADDAGLTLRSDVRGAQWVYFDADLIEKVVGNLLSNALKFTPEGGTVVVSMSADSDRVRVEVDDTGIGVAPEVQARLFERFFQADQGDRRRFGGAGIGLALCRELVELHGGEIGVRSVPGEGSTFWLELPLGVAHIAPEDIDTAETESPMPALPLPERDVADGTVVLVVEDHPDMRQYLVAHLCERFSVVEAADARVGLELVRRHDPAVIVSDIMMPVMDGLAFARALKGDPATAGIPIVLVSAKATEEDRAEGLEVADAYLSKPVRMRELLDTVARLTGAPVRDDEPEPDQTVAEARLQQRMLDTIQEHLADSGFGVKELASLLAMSPRQLQRTARRLSGLSPSELLRRERMDVARELLEAGEYSTTSEVAAQVGLSPSYFSRLYTNWFGHPPSSDLP